MFTGFMSSDARIADLEKRLASVLQDAAAVLSSSTNLEENLAVRAFLADGKERFAALEMRSVRQADQANTMGLPLGEMLHATNRVTRTEAMAQVKLALDLDTCYPVIWEAWQDGKLSQAQARGIVRGAKKLPMRISRETSTQMQHELIGYGQVLDPKALEQAAAHYYKVLDPEGAQDAEERKAARDARLAYNSRFLSFAVMDGAMHIAGQVPQLVGEQLQAQIEALVPTASSYRDAGVPVASRAARRADAFASWIGLMGTVDGAPSKAGEQPTVYVTMTAEQLETRRGAARSLATGHLVDEQATRTMACDATFARLVLSPEGEVLNLGRSQRLIKGGLRRALAARDKGCAFPGCEVPAMACDGHHIIPWQQGGTTSLGNAVLLCPAHHRLVEPDPTLPPQYHWRIELDEDTGVPWFTPPASIASISHQARTHQRHLLAASGLQRALMQKPNDQAHRENSALSTERTVPPRLAPEDDPWSPHYIPKDPQARST